MNCHPTHLLHHLARLIVRHAPHAVIPVAIVCSASPTADLRIRLPVPPIPIASTFVPGDLWVFPPAYDDVPTLRRAVDVGPPHAVAEPSGAWVLGVAVAGVAVVRWRVR